jgi:cysteine desulfurase
MRSGTHNVPGIVGLGKACEIAQEEMPENEVKIREMRDYLESELLKIEGTWINGSREQRLYNVSNIGFKGLDGQFFVNTRKNLIISNGSACTSSLIEASHVLLSMGLDSEKAFSSIRISFGKQNTKINTESAVKEFFSWNFVH